MKRNYLIALIILVTSHLSAQTERAGRKYLYEGNEFYEKGNYAESQKKYEDAIKISPENAFALYNLANTYYRTEKFEEATTFYESYLNRISDEKIKSRGYHNMGNAYLMMNEFEKSIDAYKNALRLDPNDEDTRYNLAYARRKLQQQQQQQQQQNNEQENQEQDKTKDDQENSNENDQQNQKQEQNQQQNRNNERKNASEKMTREQAEKLLNLLNSEEKQVQEALRKRDQQKSSNSSSGKQW